MLIRPSPALVEKALKRRQVRASKALDLPSLLFPQQLSFVQDPSPFKTGVCSRRAGKSTACGADLVDTVYTHEEVTALYVTGTRADAKKIIWPEVKRLNRVYDLRGKVSESDLTITYDNGSILRLSGAKDNSEIDKIRGQLPPIKKVYIDEAQKFKTSLLKELVDDVLEPALLDYDGSLCLIGTPSPIPTGYFHDAAHSDKWTQHAWTFFDNPHIARKAKKTHMELLERVLQRRGLKITDPAIQREYYGKWMNDKTSLLIHYDPVLNGYDERPRGTPNTIMGVDLGFHDADAIAILGWYENSQEVYLLEESVVRKQDITALSTSIDLLRNKWSVSKIVMDTGGIGKKVAEEFSRRKHIPVQAADKARKMENVELLNDWLRTGKFKATVDSHFSHDASLVEIDRDKTTPDRIVVSDRYHSDIIDAVLYAFRESPAYAQRKPKEKIKPGTPEYLAIEEDLMWEASQARAEADERAAQQEHEDYDVVYDDDGGY